MLRAYEQVVCLMLKTSITVYSLLIPVGGQSLLVYQMKFRL